MANLLECNSSTKAKYNLTPSGAYIEIREGVIRLRLDFHRSEFRCNRRNVEELIKACEEGHYSALSVSAYLLTHEKGAIRVTIQGCDIAWIAANKEVVDAFRWLLTAVSS